MIAIDELFSGDEWRSFHDVLSELDAVASRATPGYSRAQCRKAFEILPTHIRDIAHAWGMGDTVFRDDAYVWLRDNTVVLDPLGAHKRILPPGVVGVPSPGADNWGYDGCEFWINAWADGESRRIDVMPGAWMVMERGCVTALLFNNPDDPVDVAELVDPPVLDEIAGKVARNASSGETIEIPPGLSIDDAADFMRKVVIAMGGDPDTLRLTGVEYPGMQDVAPGEPISMTIRFS